MSNTKTTAAKTRNNAATETAPAAGVIGDNVKVDGKAVTIEQIEKGPEGWVSLGTDRLFYNPLCGKQLKGYLIDAEEMGFENPNGPFTALIIQTTAPTYGSVGEGEDAQLVEVGEGQELMIVMTEKLRKLLPYAKDPERVGEVSITPIGKILIAGGRKSMWRYDVRINPIPVSRQEVLGALWDAPQIESGNVAALPAKGK